MTGPEDVIIIRRDPGPTAATILVTVDAPGFEQAQFVIAAHLEGTAMERKIIAQQIETRVALRAAANEGEV